MLVIACTSTSPTPSTVAQATSVSPTAIAVAASSSELPGASAEPATPATADAPSPSAVASASPQPSGIAAEVARPGILSVCTSLVGAPATTTDENGQLIGYNVAFATEIAARLGLQPVIQQADFSALISMVQAHSCDVSVASQNITSDRSAQVSFIPYTQSKAGFPVVVSFGNPQTIKKLSDLCGQSVSAAQGTTNVDQVNGTGDFVGTGLNDACAADGKPAIDLHTYPTEDAAVQAVLDGTVVAYLGNSNFVAEYPNEIQKSSAELPGLWQGIGLALDHPLLIAGVQSALNAMISDGTYLEILGKYVPIQSVDNFSIIGSP
jgi:polar amino acid transport system substrate-binding protein